MSVGYNPDHSDHDQAFTALLQTTQKCNVNLNYDNLQYKQDEVEFVGETYTVKLPKLHVHQITNHLSARSDSLNQMRIATQEGDELALLKHTIMHGWPITIREVPSEIQPYWTLREELTIEDGIVLKVTQIVIPHKKHQATLQLIHEGHLGLGKCKLRAKNTVYRPGLNDQLEKLILNCELCLKCSHSKCKQKPSNLLERK